MEGAVWEEGGRPAASHSAAARRNPLGLPPRVASARVAHSEQEVIEQGLGVPAAMRQVAAVAAAVNP
jgi:hypothetical protein